MHLLKFETWIIKYFTVNTSYRQLCEQTINDCINKYQDCHKMCLESQNGNAHRGVSRRMPGSLGFNVIFSSMIFPRVFLRKNYEKQVILTEKKVLGFNITHFLATPLAQIKIEHLLLPKTHTRN